MNKRLAFTFIIITLTIDVMGIGLIIPVMPDLLQEIEGGDLGNAAIRGGILATVFAIMQFIFGPTMGSLSDRFGRRPILLVSLVIIAMRGIMANKVATNQQDEIQGIISSTQSLAVIFAPVVLTYVFYASIRPNRPVFLPGAPFLLATTIVALTLIIFVTRQKGSIGIAKPGH